MMTVYPKDDTVQVNTKIVEVVNKNRRQVRHSIESVMARSNPAHAAVTVMVNFDDIPEYLTLTKESIKEVQERAGAIVKEELEMVLGQNRCSGLFALWSQVERTATHRLGFMFNVVKA